jgi:gamma-glutamylcyclotransferase (GGCT)/AIG2-like uncharacterized protein YtfP
MSEEVKIFVYGTLKVGGYYATNFDDVRVDVKQAMVPGRIYGGAGYPRLRLNNEDNLVYGELHTYAEGDNVLRLMDRIEGYIPDRRHNLYNRKKVKVFLENGESEEAYVYEYAEDLSGRAEVLESGKWEI